MEFSKNYKVLIDTMNESEARAYIKFLDTEIVRHLDDILQADRLKQEVKEKFNL
jgi:hypothetical protein